MNAVSKSESVFFVSGMWCTSCARSIGDAVAKINGVKSANVNYASKLLYVETDEIQQINTNQNILSKVDQIGFSIKQLPAGWVLNFQETLKSEGENRLSWTFIAIVWFLSMWSSMLAFARYAGAGLTETEAFYLSVASSAFGIPAILIGIKPYALSGIRAARFNHRLTFDFFIFLGGVSAVLISIISILKSQAVSYADSGAMIIALLLLTKKIENVVVRKVTSSILLQLESNNKTVEVLKSGVWKIGELSQIRRGDRVRFKSQETISFDGKLVVSAAKINSHLLTGESTPCSLLNGDDVFAGAIALCDLEIIVQRPLGFRRIDAWAESAIIGKSRDNKYEKIFLRIESSLTTVALSGALLLCLLSILNHSNFSAAIESFFVGILIFCPCLFASIIPLAKQLSHLALLRVGVLTSRTDALFDLCKIETIYFDKTGTLQAVTSNFEKFENSVEVSSYLSAISLRSSHPLLRSFSNVELVGEGAPELNHFEEVAGEGVYATTVAGDELYVGRSQYLLGNGVVSDERWDQDFPGVAWNGKVIGQIAVKKTYDAKSEALLCRLIEKYPKLKIKILSGDPAPGAGKEFLNLNHRINYFGGLSPEEKAQLITPQSAFVGDGLNDVLALAKANVGFRIGQRTSGFAPVDFHIQVPNLNLVFNVMLYARKYRRVLIQTAAAALIYNVCAFTLAGFGKFSPLGAVVAMLASFSILLISSLRLLKVPKGST